MHIGGATTSVPPFKGADRAARWTQRLLLATLVLSALGTVSGLLQLELVSRVRPLQVMREVWHGSDPSGGGQHTSSDQASVRNQPRTPELVGWWWALFLGSNVVDTISFVRIFSARIARALAPTLDQVLALAGLHVLSNLIDIPGALVTIRLVGWIASWQAEGWHHRPLSLRPR